MDRDRFSRMMAGFAAVQPWRAPDFSKPEVAWYYYQDLKNYSYEELKTAIETHIRKADHFPSLREIHSLAGKNVADDNTRANIISMAIISAVRKFGYNNEILAMQYIGQDAEKVVKNMGGWQMICDVLTDQNLTYMQNMIKENSLAILKSNSSFLPALPEQPKLKALIGTIVESCDASKRAGNTKTDIRLAFKQRIQGMEKLPRPKDD